MAHFILEYSANLDDKPLDLDRLFEKLHACAGSSGVFPLGGIRSRAIRCDQYRIADGDPSMAFVHLTAKIGHGREIEVQKAEAEKFFTILTEHLQPIFDAQYLGISFEMRELHPVLNFKKNNIHQKFKLGSR